MIAPGRHTIAEVTRERDWGEKFPENKSYYLKFEGDDLEYEWGTKKTSQKPMPGGTFEVGSVEPSSNGYAPKIKKPKGNGGGFGGGRSPEDTARIQRQHAQEMALRFAHSAGCLSGLDLNDGEAISVVLNKQLRPLINWFDNDTKAVKG